jgi:arylsulfatase A-like enzyme
MKLPAGMTSQRRVIDDLVSSQAYAGTLLRLAGLPVPESVTGGDFTAAFTRTAHPENERVFFEHYMAHWGLHPLYGVRSRTHKYARWYGAEATEELYDLAEDPHELRNLAFDPAAAKIRATLANYANDWWTRTGGREVAYYESPDFKANKHNLPQP